VSFNLRKPPAVECWIEIETEIGEVGARWSAADTRAFMSELSDGFSAKRLRWRTELDLDPEDAQPTLSRYCDRVEGVNGSENRVVQIGQNVLIFSALRDKNPWPKFGDFCDQAMEALRAYRKHINPGEINRATLHYRDIVHIPCKNRDGGIKIEDYFKVYPQAEIPGRKLGYYSIDLYFSPSDSGDGIYLESRPLKYDEDHRSLPIELLWHSLSKVSGPVTEEQVAHSLRASNESLLEVFRACFTERGWSLFEPE
jgi:uncharacterized protein (TIGR04255 family)